MLKHVADGLLVMCALGHELLCFADMITNTMTML